MKETNKTMSYFESLKFTYSLVSDNPLFKIVLAPMILLGITGARFGIYVLVIINDIENFIGKAVKQDSPYNLMIKYMSIPFFHYAVNLLNEIFVTLFISSVIRQSFCAFTNEYVLVNYDKFHSLGSGQIHAIIQRRLIAVEEFLRLLILSVVHNFIYIISAFVEVQTKIGFKLFAANIFLFIMYLVIIFFIIKMRVYFRLKYNEAFNVVSNTCYGILTNYDVIKSYNNETREIENLDEKLRTVQSKSVIFDLLTSLSEFLQKVSLVIPNGYILYLGMCGKFFTNLNNKEMFSLYNKLFLDVKSRIATLTHDTLKVTRFLTDISDSRIVEARLDDDLKGSALSKFNKSIVFQDVDFYIQNVKICSNVNLIINKGDKIAIVGKNGSGKSTLFNILLRMRDYIGSIKIDDVEMNTISKIDQRNIISYVPQNTGIKAGSVLENLKFGKSDISDEKVIELCKNFGTHKFFSDLPDGYATECGEFGKFLSGGQNQRISFMRGVIKNGDIFIFDEHTSNLDTNGQKELVDYIFTLLKYKTCLAILHNQEDLHRFDKIVGISNGEVRVYNKYEDYKNDIHLY